MRSNFPLHHIFHPDILPQTLLTAILEYEELTKRRVLEMEDKLDHGFIKNHFESPQYGESTFSDSGHVIYQNDRLENRDLFGSSKIVRSILL